MQQGIGRQTLQQDVMRIHRVSDLGMNGFLTPKQPDSSLEVSFCLSHIHVCTLLEIISPVVETATSGAKFQVTEPRNTRPERQQSDLNQGARSQNESG
jgi:hypothetical protein